MTGGRQDGRDPQDGTDRAVGAAPEVAGEVEVEVDARGLRCPLPVIRLAEAARAAAPGTVVVLLATDPAAAHDVAAWCRMRGHTLAGTRPAAGDGGAHTAYRVVVR